MDRVATEVHNIVRNFCRGEIDDSEFISELESIEQRHPNPGNIGRAIEKGLRLADANEAEKEIVWSLSRSANPDIRRDFDEWSDASNWDIG